jgi:alkanesulfonate monooxygenase SsuD/methylene tetrahydromethanopterin reductase-like flavin-dependent oxidoreductase (luciferase family)
VTDTRAASPREVRFGYFLVPNAVDPLLDTAHRVENLGLDYVGIQDHPYQGEFVETWSLMAMIAATTTTLRVFPDVANLPLRRPALIAKAAATIDLLSGGRFDLGLGPARSGTRSRHTAARDAARRVARRARRGDHRDPQGLEW